MKYRPLSILAMASAIRDILLGIGFIAGWSDITQTLIYQNYNDLFPGYSGPVVGILFILAGVSIIIGAVKTNRRFMVQALNFQALAWLFSTIVYMLNGNFILAAIFGTFFSFPAGFMAFHIKYNPPQDQVIDNVRSDHGQAV